MSLTGYMEKMESATQKLSLGVCSKCLKYLRFKNISKFPFSDVRSLMKTVKIGINGVGRIGRTILRAYFDRIDRGVDTNLEVVGINNPGDPTPYIHLLKYDSLHGKLKGDFSFNKETREISYNGRKIKFFDMRNPEELPW